MNIIFMLAFTLSGGAIAGLMLTALIISIETGVAFDVPIKSLPKSRGKHNERPKHLQNRP